MSRYHGRRKATKRKAHPALSRLVTVEAKPRSLLVTLVVVVLLLVVLLLLFLLLLLLLVAAALGPRAPAAAGGAAAAPPRARRAAPQRRAAAPPQRSCAAPPASATGAALRFPSTTPARRVPLATPGHEADVRRCGLTRQAVRARAAALARRDGHQQLSQAVLDHLQVALIQTPQSSCCSSPAEVSTSRRGRQAHAPAWAAPCAAGAAARSTRWTPRRPPRRRRPRAAAPGPRPAA